MKTILVDKNGMRLLLCVYKTEQGMTSNGETWLHGMNLCLPLDVTVMLNLSTVHRVQRRCVCC